MGGVCGIVGTGPRSAHGPHQAEPPGSAQCQQVPGLPVAGPLAPLRPTPSGRALHNEVGGASGGARLGRLEGGRCGPAP